MSSETPSVDRRTVVRVTGATLTGALLAGCSGSSGAPSAEEGGSSGGGGGDTPTESGGGTATPTEGSGGGASVDSWMEDVGNYEGVADETGQSEVTVAVGAEGNGGAFAYSPAAVRVASGTTVVWEWTGKGSPHNVAAKDGSFESELLSEEGATFEHTFESSGTYRYYCTPHKSLGMKGVVVVE